MGSACARREYNGMQPVTNETKHPKAPFADIGIIFSLIEADMYGNYCMHDYLNLQNPT